MFNPTKTHETADPFADFFATAEKTNAYWEELASIEFTEEVVERMKEISVNRSELARRMGVQPSFITRLLSGENNFELATMTRISRALDCDFRCHLQPHGTEAMWINVLKEEPPVRQKPCEWRSTDYRPVSIPAAKSRSDDKLAIAS